MSSASLIEAVDSFAEKIEGVFNARTFRAAVTELRGDLAALKTAGTVAPDAPSTTTAADAPPPPPAA